MHYMKLILLYSLALVSSDEDSSDEGDGMLGSGRAVLTHKRSSG